MEGPDRLILANRALISTRELDDFTSHAGPDGTAQGGRASGTVARDGQGVDEGVKNVVISPVPAEPVWVALPGFWCKTLAGVRACLDELAADGSVLLSGRVVFPTSAPFRIDLIINGENDMLPSESEAWPVNDLGFNAA